MQPRVLTISPAAATNGVITPLGHDGGEPWAVWRPINPLDTDPTFVVDSASDGASRLAMWSGSLASWGEGEHGIATADPRTWSPAGWAKLEHLCASLERAPAPAVCFRTHAAHVLSDVPSCARFLREWGTRGFSIILDPAAMLAPSMLGAVPDHLTRIIEFLAPLSGVAAVVLANLQPSNPPDDPPALSPLHRGQLDPALFVDLVRRHVPPSTPLILLDDEPGAQLPLLSPILAPPPAPS